jgi:serine/threonine protein kinase
MFPSPIDAISSILSVALKIKEVAHTVKANKNQCRILSERVQIIFDMATAIRKGVKDLATFKASMESTERCLGECLTFMIKFQDIKWFKKVISNGSHKEKFAELNDNLQKCIGSFNLGVAIDLDIKFDKAKDMAAEEEDRKILTTKPMQELILQENAQEQRELQKVYALQQKINDNKEKQALNEQKTAELMQQQILAIKKQLEQLAAPEQPKPRFPVDKSLIVKLADLDILGYIGEGNNATVYAGKLYGMDVAIKKLKNPTPQLLQELYREATILSRLKSDSIIRCHGVCLEEGEECLITELMHGGSLKTNLAEPTQLITEELKKQWALEMANGVNCLHKQGVIHRDLKSTNILISRDGHAKIADFDLSVMNTASIGAVEYTGISYEYMAPELKCLKPKASTASDIYSFGTILWELVTRQPAPLNKSDSLLANIPDAYKSIIARCWQDSPAKRPQLDEIISIIEAYQPLDCRVLYQQGAEHEKASRFKEAFDCYVKSAELGYGRSEFRLAMLLLQGKTGAPNKKEAFNYMLKCANHESHDQPKACFNLASMLEKGDGATQDLAQALHWYSESARLGNPDAPKKLEELKRKGTPNYQDNLSSFGLASVAPKPMLAQPKPTAPLMDYGTPSAPPMSASNNYQDNLTSMGLVSQMPKLAIK